MLVNVFFLILLKFSILLHFFVNPRAINDLFYVSCCKIFLNSSTISSAGMLAQVTIVSVTIMKIMWTLDRTAIIGGQSVYTEQLMVIIGKHRAVDSHVSCSKTVIWN